MSESALRAALDLLEASQSSLHGWLNFWTLLVVLGVALEIAFAVREYREQLHDFNRGTIHTPDRPKVTLLIFGLLGAGLVAVGVAGEFVIDAKLGTVETNIRKANDNLYSLLSEKAGDAAQSATIAHDEADVVRNEADAIQKRLHAASKQLSDVEELVRIQGPRRRLLEDGRDKFLEAIKPFAGQRVTVVHCGYELQAEPEQLEQSLLNLLGVSKVSKPNAGWAVESPGYTTWAKCNTGASAAGGNLVIVSSTADRTVKAAATALYDALNGIDISTIQTESTPESRQLELQFLGDDSPWELAIKDPKAVIILIGTNPMFDLSGWHERHK
jgi:hypothetical protein